MLLKKAAGSIPRRLGRTAASATATTSTATRTTMAQPRSPFSTSPSNVKLSYRIATGGKDLQPGATVPAGCGRPPMVVLHGLLGSAPNMRQFTLSPRISGDRAVVRVDLRNHGSSPHSDAMTTAAMAGDLVRLLDDLGLDSAVVLGHSLGGRVAMMTALHHPERVSALIASDIAPVQYPESEGSDPGTSLRGIITSLSLLDLAEVSSRSDAMERLKPRIPSEAIRGFALMNLDGRPGEWRWKCNLAVLKQSLNKWDDFPALLDAGNVYTGPSLFARGGNSDYVQPGNPEHMNAIETLFPSYRLETIEGAGHWLHAEKPKDFVELTARFLDDIEGV